MDKLFILLLTLSSILCVNCCPTPGVKSLVAYGKVDDGQLQMEVRKAIETIVLRNLLNPFRPEVAARIVTAGIGTDKRSAMGVDLPDFMMNYNGKVPITDSYREKMERNGRR